MRLGVTGFICVLVAAMFSGPVSARSSHGGNCVAYVRDVTGISVSGNAGLWWNHAQGRYRRGHEPQIGAVLVFRPYGRMHSGHVAVVSRVINKREILVDQANWVRGRVTRAMTVIDTSTDNSWTAVKVLSARSRSGARDNPTFGFIYPERPAPLGDTVLVSDTRGEAPLDDMPRVHRHHRSHLRHAALHRHHRHRDDDETARAGASRIPTADTAPASAVRVAAFEN